MSTRNWRGILVIGGFALVVAANGGLTSSRRAVAQTISIEDVGPRAGTFSPSRQHSFSGRILSLTVAMDGRRMYAGTLAGVWRSDDAGVTWRQMTRPQPPQGQNDVLGALGAPNVYDVTVSLADRNLVLAAATSEGARPKGLRSTDGIYRSTDGGDTWELTHRFPYSQVGSCQFDANEISPVGQIVFAPDNPALVYAAGGCAVAISSDAGKNWTEKVVDTVGTSKVWHLAVGPETAPSGQPSARRVYALGEGRMWLSPDGGTTWLRDYASIPSNAGGLATIAGGSSARVLAVEPGQPDRVYVAVPGSANGLSFFHKSEFGPPGTRCQLRRTCGEGSLWLGDYSAFAAGTAQPAAKWKQLPGPPVYWGVSTPSGTVYVVTKTTPGGYLLFFSDMSHVHVTAGRPLNDASWHRLDGRDVSQSWSEQILSNKLFVHADPHSLVVSPDFTMSLQAPSPALRVGFTLSEAIPFPYNQNKVETRVQGTIWMANDGGIVHRSGTNGNWSSGRGLSTLAAVNVAGIALKGTAPALFMGTGDNDNFFSTDGGRKWAAPKVKCGDCSNWFTDPAQPSRVLYFGPRERPGGLIIYRNRSQKRYPNPSSLALLRVGIPPAPIPGTEFQASTETSLKCPVGCNADTRFAFRGYRPIVQTVAGESPLANGDYVVIGTKQDGKRAVFRKTSDSGIETQTDWEDTKNAVQYGPDLPLCCNKSTPNCLDVVQASGGHASPVLFVGDPGPADGDRAEGDHSLELWKWQSGMDAWKKIVPGGSGQPTTARRFFVSPYNPNLIYIIDQDAIKRSDDGGSTWSNDDSLTSIATEDGNFVLAPSAPYPPDWTVIQDIVFDGTEPGTRFAVGAAGVFYTLDGATWVRLLSTSAYPSHPVSAFFDRVSDPCNRALYVAFSGRSVVRIAPIPSAMPVPQCPP